MSAEAPAGLESAGGSSSTPGSADGQDRAWQVKAALDSFRVVTNDEDRRKAYLALVAALDAVPEVGQTAEYSRYRNETLSKLVSEVGGMQERVRAEEEALANPPAKPDYEPPKYSGAYYLEGVVKRCYGDGVAIESGSKYYFLRDEPCPPLANILHGYVEDALDTVQLDLGRDGREAIVLNVRDKETADDDRARFRAEVTEYQKQYQQSLEEFKAASKARKELLAQTSTRAARTEAARVAAEKLDQLLVALAKGETLDAAAVESATKTIAAQPEPAVDRDARPSVTDDRPVQQRAPTAAKRSPMACMKGCIGGCGGDPDCERRCVAKDCRAL